MGTRPEAIKLAPVVGALRAAGADTIVCSTGQHRELLAQALRPFGLRPDVDLALMTSGQSPAEVLAAVVPGVQEVIRSVRPTRTLVQGDTATVLGSALASFYEKVPVAHVEAGLRTDTIYSPFPEEMYRRLTTRIADTHFAPTERARQALLSEGIDPQAIEVTGNTVIDALLAVAAMPAPAEAVRLLEEADVCASRPLVLLTSHRRENFGPGLERICAAVASIAQCATNARVIFPVHLNPAVQVTVHAMLKGLANVILVDPVPYDTMVHLMKVSHGNPDRLRWIAGGRSCPGQAGAGDARGD